MNPAEQVGFKPGSPSPLERGLGGEVANQSWLQTAAWYYGWKFETGELFAYDLAGNTVPLLTIDVDIQPRGWRLDGERALAVLSVGGVTGLYILSSTGAQQVVPTLGAEAILPEVTRLAARSDPYVILVAESGAYGIGLLVNLARNLMEPLNGETYTPLDNWRFSADGTRLRYLSRQDRDSQDWSIWERDLASGDERGIHSFASPFPVIQASGTGDQWVYRSLQGNQMIYTVVLSDGSSQILAQVPVINPADPMTVYQLYRDNLLVYTAPCAEACSIEARPLAGGSAAVFALSAIPAPQLEPLTTLPDGLVVFIQDTFWRLNTAQVVSLGIYSAAVFTQPPAELVSPDGAWLAALTPDGNVHIVSTATGTAALSVPAGNRMQVHYDTHGVLVTSEDPRRTTLYRLSDGLTAELPHTGGDFYTEILPDGTVFYVLTAPVGERPAGIYRYNPTDGAFILAAQDLFPLILE
jgi:hypothetical protein